MFRSDWVCAGLTDELPPPKGWSAISVGGLPVLLVRDADGELRAFLNVCRHRASPLCDTGATGSGTVIRCPYHAWVYRLDGTLAKASGVGTPDGFDVADFGLKPVAVAQLAAHGLDQRRRSDRRRSIPDRSQRRSTSSRSSRSTSRCASRDRAAVQLEGAARELLGELPHPVRASPDRHLGEGGLPDGERRPRALRLGPAAAIRRRDAVRTDPGDAAARRAGVGVARCSVDRPPVRRRQLPDDLAERDDQRLP